MTNIKISLVERKYIDLVLWNYFSKNTITDLILKLKNIILVLI